MSFSNITNIYELLDQEGEEGVRKVAPAKTAGKPAPAKGASSAPTKSVAQTSSSKPQSTGDNQRRGGEGRGGERRDNRGGERSQGNFRGGENRPPRQQRDNGNFSAPAPASGFGGAEGAEQSGSVEFARRGNGPRDGTTRHTGDRYTGERRGASGEGYSGAKRTYDRKSGTGRGNSVGREEKRQGGGRNNWGRNDGTEVTDAEADAALEGEASTAEDVHGAEKTEERVETEEQKARREEREKDDKLITLEEYNRQKEAKRSQSSVLGQGFAVRKANEGVDDKTAKKWGSMEQVKRDEEDNKAAKAAEGDSQKKDKKKVQQIELNFTVKDSQPRAPQEDREERRGGRGGARGGRGGSRGGESRGRGGAARGGDRAERGERPERRQQQQGGPEVNFSDPNSFPTLA